MFNVKLVKISGFVAKTVVNAMNCYAVEDCASLEAAIAAVKAYNTENEQESGRKWELTLVT